MAKMKTFAVKVRWTEETTIYVTARRPQGAIEKALTDEEFRAAGPLCDDESPCYGGYPRLPKDIEVVETRVVT